MAKILKLQVKQEADEHSDGADYLGTYSDTWAPGAVNREKALGYRFWTGREFRFWHWAREGDDDGFAFLRARGWSKQAAREEVARYKAADFRRMEDLQNGGWFFVGVWAEAEVQSEAGGVVQRLRSGGLWGIESDGGAYLADVGREELAGLREELEAFGIRVAAEDWQALAEEAIDRAA